MEITVQNEEEKRAVLAVCSAACRTGDLGISRAAVVMSESVKITSTKPKEKLEKKHGR